MRRAIAGLVAVIACIATACIIGPKQDDPADDRALIDAGTIYSDTSPGASMDAAVPNTDTSTSATDDTGPQDSTDASDASDASDSSGANDASDATEGG